MSLLPATTENRVRKFNAIAETGEFARGWVVLFAGTIGCALGITGLPFFSFGQFIRPLSQTFGWSRGEISGGVTCLMIGTILTSPLYGRAVDQFGYRKVALASQAGLALGYIALSLIGPSVPWFYAAWLFLSFAGSGTSPVVWTRAIAGRFRRSRGVALGILLCGTGVTALAAPVIVNQLIALAGWRATYQVLAATMAFVGLPLTYFFLHAESDEIKAASTHAGATVKEALRSSAFWRVIAGIACISTVAGGVIVHLPALLTDRGLTSAAAAGIAGLLGYTIIIGRLGLGYLVDRVSPAWAGAALVGLAAIACFMLAQGYSPVIAVLLFGLCCGAEVDLLAFLMSNIFGLRHYAQIYAFGISAFTLGAGIGPIVAGRVHDRTGNYNLALYGFVVLIVVACALIASLANQVTASHETSSDEAASH